MSFSQTPGTADQPISISSSPPPTAGASLYNPIDLTSTSPTRPRDHPDNPGRFTATQAGAGLTGSPYTRPSLLDIGEASIAPNPPAVFRTRSSTSAQTRYRRPSASSRPDPRYAQPVYSRAPMRPHSNSTPALPPSASSSAAALPSDFVPPLYTGPQPSLTALRSQHPNLPLTLDDILDATWARNRWGDSPPSREPRTFGEIMNNAARNGSSRRASRAEWQPDDDASVCTRCGSEFGLLKRRHHCRKCGQVVCAPCSRHQIQMPKRFIAQPPGYGDSESDMDGSGGDELQTVRVCDPCVPDPNYGPPPQFQAMPIEGFGPHHPRRQASLGTVPSDLYSRRLPPLPHEAGQMPVTRPPGGIFTAGPPPHYRSVSHGHFHAPMAGSSATSLPAPPPPRPRVYPSMAVYIASEKDARYSNDEEAPECVICLDEFEVGNELALLECFCKFHKKCIIDWWDKDSAASCPTHKLRE